jgi:acyl carrier protein
MFGSIVSVCGNAGQSNYAAANCFLESFTKHARATGYPAAVIQLGAMRDVGFVSENPELLKLCRQLSLQTLTEKDLIKVLSIAIRQARIVRTVEEQQNMGSLILGLRPMVGPAQLSAYQNDRRMAFYDVPGKRSDQGKSSDSGRINKFISEATRNPSLLDLQSSIDLLVEEIAHLVHTEESEVQSLQTAAEITIDSLMTIEIRSWLRKSIGVEVPSLQITKARNVGGLASLVIQLMKEKQSECAT